MRTYLRLALVAGLGLLASGIAMAQAKTTEEGIAEYRKMLEDGNPAELYEAKGEALWKTARGPKNATLERCDLGKGPDVVKGAFVELPRYFADTGKVQDLETSKTCPVTSFAASEHSATHSAATFSGISFFNPSTRFCCSGVSVGIDDTMRVHANGATALERTLNRCMSMAMVFDIATMPSFAAA